MENDLKPPYPPPQVPPGLPDLPDEVPGRHRGKGSGERGGRATEPGRIVLTGSQWKRTVWLCTGVMGGRCDCVSPAVIFFYRNGSVERPGRRTRFNRFLVQFDVPSDGLSCDSD